MITKGWRRLAARVLTIACVACLQACSREAKSPDAAHAPAARAAVGPAPGAGDSVPVSPRAVVGRAPVIGGVRPIVALDARGEQILPTPSGVPILDQYLLTFVPEVLFVRTGQSAEFRNSDGVLHNIRVRVTGSNVPAFNIALPTGGIYRHMFDRTGIYDVLCDIHTGMSAAIIASSTPYAMIADAKGNFVFNDVPPGKYTLTAYLSAGRRLDRDVDVGEGRTEVTIE
ncbi:MAG: hypothetical protein DMF89_03025 [Acidobacteria bacterium]|nr:MAG: hypothetical protein DMF89_03025 [Acidobacteriota bacterium]